MRRVVPNWRHMWDRITLEEAFVNTLIVVNVAGCISVKGSVSSHLHI